MEIAWEGWLLVGIGVWAIIDGIRFHLGVSRSWFYVIAIPGIMMPNMMFGSIPIGVGSLSLGLLILVEQDSWLFEKTGPLMWYVMGLCFVLAAIFWVFKPRFIQPEWYRWLWKHHGAIMPELKKDAERLGETWVKRTRTQAGLEQWALEVRHRPWLESHYPPDKVTLLLNQARSDPQWAERAATLEGLVAWARQTAGEFNENQTRR